MSLGNALGLAVLSKINFQLKGLWIFFIVSEVDETIFNQVASGDIAGAGNTLLSNWKLFLDGADNPLALAQLCQRVSLPRQTFEIANHDPTNRKYYAKVNGYPSFTAEFLETAGADIQKYFLNWESQIADKDSKLFRINQSPKRHGYLMVFNTSSGLLHSALNLIPGALGATIASAGDAITSSIPSGIWHYDGISYEGMEPVENNYDEGGGQKISVTMHVDKIVPLVLGFSELQIVQSIVQPALESLFSGTGSSG